MRMTIGRANPPVNENQAPPPPMGDNGGPPMEAEDEPASQEEPEQPGQEIEGPGEPVSPEEQAEYEKIVNNAAQIIYGTRDGSDVPIVLAMAAGDAEDMEKSLFAEVQPPLGEGPIEDIAAAIAFTALMIDASAQQAGVELGNDAMYHAFIEEVGPQIIDDAANGAGLKLDERSETGAIFRAVDLYRQTSSRVDQEALGQEFGVIKQADAEGRVGELMPALQRAMDAQGNDNEPQQEVA